VADEAKVREMSRWMVQHYREFSASISDYGSGVNLGAMTQTGNLPTRNFRDGLFEEADAISANVMMGDIGIGMEGCHACPIRCKKVIKTGAPYFVEPAYGGPEYETLASLGSNCGVNDPEAVSKGHEICNANAIDAISAGSTVAFAMECFENGLITPEQTGGLELRFGNGEAMVKVLEMICDREGIGDLLAEGTKRAAQEIGQGAERFAIQVKGVDMGMHEPRGKQVLGMGYAVCGNGADHGAGHSRYHAHGRRPRTGECP